MFFGENFKLRLKSFLNIKLRLQKAFEKLNNNVAKLLLLMNNAAFVLKVSELTLLPR